MSPVAVFWVGLCPNVCPNVSFVSVFLDREHMLVSFRVRGHTHARQHDQIKYGDTFALIRSQVALLRERSKDMNENSEQSARPQFTFNFSVFFQQKSECFFKKQSVCTLCSRWRTLSLKTLAVIRKISFRLDETRKNLYNEYPRHSPKKINYPSLLGDDREKCQ